MSDSPIASSELSETNLSKDRQSTTAPTISLRNVTKTFRVWNDRPDSLKAILSELTRGNLRFGRKTQWTILDRVNFDIRPGEFVGIMGRNGAGKSTILKLISGIYVPNAGQVVVNGRVAPLLELGAGFSDELTGYDNIFLNGSILGYSRDAIRQRLSTIIEFSELGEHIHQPVKKYSSGMLVRLAFSIAAHLDAPILLFDEILAVGDVGFQTKCLLKIKELHLEGRTIVLITHDASAVRDNCERCILINECRVIFDGPAAEGARLYLELFSGTTTATISSHQGVQSSWK